MGKPARAARSWADHVDGAVVHLNHRDVTFVAVSRAPLEKLSAYKRRRADLNVREEELHGLSAFALEDGVVYHSYSCYDRGTDVLHGTWQLLDRAPKGRGDVFENWPLRHDEYE